jgi:16S rRNA (guanine1207-N2)-methyltransferase
MTTDTSITSTYYQAIQSEIYLSGETIHLITKPGLPAWERTLPSAELFTENISLRGQERVLLQGCPHGAVAVILARQLPTGSLWIRNNSIIALNMSLQTLAANQVENAHVPIDNDFHAQLPPELIDSFDIVAMQLPKGRKLARRWLVESQRTLKPGGIFYLVGANDQGIQSLGKDLRDLYGNIALLGYKKGNRIYQAMKQGLPDRFPEWINEPGIAPGSWVEFKVPIAERHLILRSLPGIFSYDHLDEGTSLLLQNVNIPGGVNVLDIGCGYGIIGLAAACQGAAHVTLVDENILAVTAALENIRLNNLPNISAQSGDLYDTVSGNRYDLILSNPPFHTGKEINYQIAHTLIVQAFQLLNPGGRLILVSNIFIRYDRLMSQVFGSVQVLAATGKFHVLAGTK